MDTELLLFVDAKRKEVLDINDELLLVIGTKI
jgi:hypothetical protein